MLTAKSRAGLGLTLAEEETIRPCLERGKLVAVREEPFHRYYLYYPQRRQRSRALRALMDDLLTMKLS